MFGSMCVDMYVDAYVRARMRACGDTSGCAYVCTWVCMIVRMAISVCVYVPVLSGEGTSIPCAYVKTENEQRVVEGIYCSDSARGHLSLSMDFYCLIRDCALEHLLPVFSRCLSGLPARSPTLSGALTETMSANV
jgi:hypothetical protein